MRGQLGLLVILLKGLDQVLGVFQMRLQGSHLRVSISNLSLIGSF
jgi:hypothetical protein